MSKMFLDVSGAVFTSTKSSNRCYLVVIELFTVKTDANNVQTNLAQLNRIPNKQ